MPLLQIGQQVITRGIDVVFQYGVLGLACATMAFIIYYYEKQRKIREGEIKVENTELKGRVLALEDKFREYQDVDRKRMEDLIEKNLFVMEDVRSLLRK